MIDKIQEMVSLIFIFLMFLLCKYFRSISARFSCSHVSANATCISKKFCKFDRRRTCSSVFYCSLSLSFSLFSSSHHVNDIVTSNYKRRRFADRVSYRAPNSSPPTMFPAAHSGVGVAGWPRAPFCPVSVERVARRGAIAPEWLFARTSEKIKNCAVR